MVEGNRERLWVGKDKILVQTQREVKKSYFYIMDLKDNKVTEVGGNLLCNHNMLNGLIAADSLIYAIGSPVDDDQFSEEEEEEPHDVEDCHIHSGASFLDLTEGSGAKWKGIGGMLNCDRSYPSCVSLGNNIFVFGASYADAPWAFGEFYDKEKNGWEAIPSPPESDHRLSPVISDPNHNRLLVHFGFISSLYAYYPDQNHRWVCLDDHMPWSSWPGEPAPSPVDDVLYFIIQSYKRIDRDCIAAYDISTKKPLQVSWSTCSPFGPNELGRLTFLHILYLGDNILCLPYTHSVKDLNTSLFKFFRFQVCRVSQQQVLLTPLSVHLLPVEGIGSIVNFVPL